MGCLLMPYSLSSLFLCHPSPTAFCQYGSTRRCSFRNCFEPSLLCTGMSRSKMILAAALNAILGMAHTEECVQFPGISMLRCKFLQMNDKPASCSKIYVDLYSTVLHPTRFSSSTLACSWLPERHHELLTLPS